MYLAGESTLYIVALIVIYSQFLLNTLFIGYSIGVAPVIGFCYGNNDDVQQKRVFSISMGFLAAVSILTFAVSRLGGPYLAQLFADNSSPVCQIAAEGFAVFHLVFFSAA